MAGFYYDIVCPYAYMAFTVLRKSNAFKKINIELRPILLGGLFKLMEVDVDPNKTMSSTKAEYIKNDIKRQAEFFDVPLNFHPRHPVSTVKAMRLISASDESLRESVTERLYRAYFQENLDIDDDDILEKIAAEVGIENNQQIGKERLLNATSQAFEKKVFGVPTIDFNQRLYFGCDRLFLIKDQLQISWPDAPWKSCDHKIDFYFDFSSPYSFLAWGEVKKALSLGVKINLKPILLGALFKEIGMVNIPMLNAHPHKVSYYADDMKDWATHRGIDFNFSPYFPLRSVTALRVAILEPRVIDVIFTAAWSLKKNISDEKTLGAILHGASFNEETLLERAQDENIKERLKTQTNEALQRGVFGVPTFFVKGQKVFGQDRFSWIRQELSKL